MSPDVKIKKDLILRIEETNNLELLETLQAILEASDVPAYEMSEDQKKAVEESRKQIEEGNCIENDTAISNLRQWLLNQ
jgi:hypothetical protein